MTGRTCPVTGLHLIEAGGETAFRVAKDRYGALSVRANDHVGPMPLGSDPDAGDARGRFDTIGSTIYLADSRQAAYAEVLVGFRKDRAKIAEAAGSIGMSIDEYLAAIIADAKANGVATPWAIPVDWQMQRSIFEIRMPLHGWWVGIDHPDTFQALENLVASEVGPLGLAAMLTDTEVTGLDRDLTTALAHLIREQVLDDGSEPLGISYASRTRKGRCWAYWDRRTDEGLPPGSNDLVQLISENVGPDAEFTKTAEFYNLPVLGGR